ncbi:MAG: helix-turn-helix transcriptional regulator [Methyloceanibacter sp.]|uniref:helix-turn-helix transcriptional regulator n=1 Tax=Methyloceanibacter sp. TaxID=1965321 RepID=UPI003D6CB35E
MMPREEELSGLIGGIYDASLDPSLWPGVLGRATSFVQGSAASLISKDAASKTGTIYYLDGGIDAHYVQLYFDKYVKLDPTSSAMLLAEVGEPLATADLISYEEFIETRFYTEWVKPQGLVDCVNVILDKSATSVAVFNVFRHEQHGLANDEMRRRMRLVAPHVRRAVLISRVIDLKTTQADTFAAMLDGLSAGMFLVDADGRIVHANAAGHAMLADGSFLRAVNGRLAPVDPDAASSLREVFAAAGLDDSAVGTGGISVPLTARQGEPLVAHALPLTSGARRDTGNAYKAVAALFVHRAPLDTPSPPEVIAKTFKLTPSEIRVLLAVVQVGGVLGVADALGISENTVKTHLKRLYAKTGQSRQADLVRLVAKFSSPLA